MASWLLLAMVSTIAVPDCVQVRYAENGRPLQPTDLVVTANVGGTRTELNSCAGGFVAPDVGVQEVVANVEVKVHGRAISLGALPASCFLRVFYWELGVFSPPFRGAMRKEVVARERAEKAQVDWVYTFTPQSRDGDPVSSTGFVFQRKAK